ncbi:amino acid aminotransferase [Marinimicrobium alkaliphilum]|uniref:amino acid aminotransferase n=1 Tax=Marinimicrobium alkaliphilum TaxID=2202654 RepID=UPI000DBA5D58|nr:amino acid aminotransferase [Marinimicrobium alkaliphilum]
MFETLPQLPADPILGLSVAFQQDNNPDKVDLGVGVYKDDAGRTPIMAAVHAAEQRRLEQEDSKAYTNPAGYPGANAGVNELVFGADHPALAAERVRTIQTPGGCGALRVAAELIRRARPEATIWVSSPTWANHVPLLGNAGIALQEYPYYDHTSHSIDFDAMLASLRQVAKGDLVLLHACCHNPSGADLTQVQWQAVADVAREREFTPFIDMAYQGFGEGLDQDAYGVRLLAQTQPELLVASSFSKNFGLYRERAGSLSLVLADRERADAIHTQMLNVTRGLYSMPPAHGAALVDIILHDSALSTQWRTELDSMRARIQGLREQLVDALSQRQQTRDFGFIARERGMFSFLGLSVGQVHALRARYSIYMTDNSRINIAGLNPETIAYVADAIAEVLAQDS